MAENVIYCILVTGRHSVFRTRKFLIMEKPMVKKLDFHGIKEKLMPVVGPPAFPGGKNRQPVLNQQWVAALCQEVCEPIYDKASSSFYIYNPDTGVWECKTTAEMVALISRIMMQYAHALGDTFVDSKRDVATIYNVLEFLKAACAEENAFQRRDFPFIRIQCTTYTVFLGALTRNVNIPSTSAKF